MADPIGTITGLFDLASKGKAVWDYVQKVIGARDKIKELQISFQGVESKVNSIKDYIQDAAQPDAPEKALLQLYDKTPSPDPDHPYVWTEGPVIRQLRASIESLEYKTRDFRQQRADKSPSRATAGKERDISNDIQKSSKTKAISSQGLDGVRHRSPLSVVKGLFHSVQRADNYRRVVFPLEEEEIRQAIDDMERYSSRINDVLVQMNTDLSRAILKAVNGLGRDNLRREQDQRYVDIARWLNRFEFRKRHNEHLDILQNHAIDHDLFMQGDAYQDWVAAGPQRLLIEGEPGSGKSVLSSQIIEHLRNASSISFRPAVLYLFIDSKQQKEQTHDALFTSLLSQFVEYVVHRHGVQAVPENVLTLWQEERINRAKPPFEDVRRLLAEGISKLERTFIIIDGLDELLSSTRRLLRQNTDKLLKTINPPEGPGKLSLLLTSRSYGKDAKMTEKVCEGIVDGRICGKRGLKMFFKCKLSGPSGVHGDDFHLCKACAVSGKNCNKPPHQLDYHPRGELEVTLRASEASIERYIAGLIEQERLSNQSRPASQASNDSVAIDGRVTVNPQNTSPLARMLRGNEKLEQKIIETIVEKSDCICMRAAMQWKHLVEVFSESTIDSVLDNLPKELEDRYEFTLDRIARAGTVDARKKGNRVLMWVSQARRILNFDELVAAVELEDQEVGLDRYYMIDAAQGLVSVEKHGIEIAQRPARDYLRRPDVQKKRFPEGQRLMAVTCLQVLTDERLQEPADRAREDEIIEDRIRDMPFVAYSSQYWGFHAQTCQSDPEVASLLRKLLTEDGYRTSALQISQYCEKDHSSGWSARKGVNALHIAAWFGLEFVFDELVQSGLDIDGHEENETRRTPLIYACRGGRGEAVQMLLGLGASVEMPDLQRGRGWPPLFHAALTENAAAMKVLCADSKIKVNAREPVANRPLIVEVAKRGLVAELRALLEHPDIEVNTQDSNGFTALMAASKLGLLEPVQVLLRVKEIDTELADSQSDSTALRHAAENGADDVVRALLEHGASPDSRDKLDGTPLRRAIDSGHQAVIQVFKDMNLIKLTGTDDKYGKNLLFAAAIQGHSFIVQDLIAAGFPVNSRSKTNGTPLHDAAAAPDNRIKKTEKMATVKVLIGAGADVNLKDDDGNTASDLAYAKGDNVTGDFLNPSTGSISTKRSTRDQPATWLARHGMVKYIEARLQQADTDFLLKTDVEGESPLSIAIYSHHYDCVRPLLAAYTQQGEPIDKPSTYKRTALHEAAKSAHEWLVKHLLAHVPAPAVNVADSIGNTPLSEAMNSGNDESVIALLEAGADFGKFHPPTEELLTSAIRAENVDVARKIIKGGVQNRPRHRKLAREIGNADMIVLLTTNMTMEFPGNDDGKGKQAVKDQDDAGFGKGAADQDETSQGNSVTDVSTVPKRGPDMSKPAFVSRNRPLTD